MFSQQSYMKVLIESYIISLKAAPFNCLPNSLYFTPVFKSRPFFVSHSYTIVSDNKITFDYFSYNSMAFCQAHKIDNLHQIQYSHWICRHRNFLLAIKQSIKGNFSSQISLPSSKIFRQFCIFTLKIDPLNTCIKFLLYLSPAD